MGQSIDEILDGVHHWALSKAMAKALRWAEPAGEADLTRWIRLESLGYWQSNPVMTPSTVVPEYRTVEGQWFDEYGRALVLSDPNLAFINQTRLRLGVAELESYLGVKGILALPVPEHAALISEHLKVDVSTFRFDPRSVPPVLASIRARLVDELARKPRLSPTVARSSSLPDEEIVELRPNFAGIGINLRALWRRWRADPGDE